jgi:leucyl-tRNA synthetase
VMSFIQGVKKRLDAGESTVDVFGRKLLFDERAVLGEMVPLLKQVVRNCQDTVVVELEAARDAGSYSPPGMDSAVPGGPTFSFENI